MQINSLAFSNPEASELLVQPGGHRVPWPCKTWHREHIEAFLAAGGVIGPFPSATLEELKSARRREIDSERDRRMAEGVSFDFGGGDQALVDTRDQRDLLNVNGVVTTAMLLQQQGITDPVIEFRAADNVTRRLTPAQAVDLGLAVQARVKAVYAASWAHKDAIDALVTVAEVESYDITAGWPA